MLGFGRMRCRRRADFPQLNCVPVLKTWYFCWQASSTARCNSCARNLPCPDSAKLPTFRLKNEPVPTHCPFILDANYCIICICFKHLIPNYLATLSHHPPFIFIMSILRLNVLNKQTIYNPQKSSIFSDHQKIFIIADVVRIQTKTTLNCINSSRHGTNLFYRHTWEEKRVDMVMVQRAEKFMNFSLCATNLPRLSLS